MNSGAGALLTFWTPRAFANSTATAISDATGLDVDEVLALISGWAHLDDDDPIPAEKLTLAPSSSGTDQTARDSAATAATAAAAAQTEIDGHEASTHNTDITARSTARNARQVGEQAQTELGDTPECHPQH